MFRIAPCHVNRDASYLQVVGPLLHERDLYLAWSLKRSKAVNGEHQWRKGYKLRYTLVIVCVCAYCIGLLSITCGLPQATTFQPTHLAQVQDPRSRCSGLLRASVHAGTKSVVGVIGRGHVRGVLYNLTTPNSSGLRFRDLVGSKAEREGGPSRRQRIARRIALELLLAAGAYFAWEAFRTRT